MSWPGFSALPAAFLFLLLAPLILFYFLKLRRPRMEVPSLALWRQVIADQRVNSPFQKFKRNLLLLLQILMLCAVVLAAMQPYWPAGDTDGQAIPVMIDVSASMGSLDPQTGKTRLELAKEQVRNLIDNLLPNQRLSLISVDSTARRLTDFTDNQRVLREALAKLELRPVASRLEDGLRMAQVLARTAPVKTVVLVTDGNVPGNIDFELPFTLNFQKLPPAGDNVGVVEFNARRTKGGWDVFVRMEASGESADEDDSPATPAPGETAPPVTEKPVVAARLVEVELVQDGLPIKREAVSIRTGEAARVSFSIETEASASLEVRIKPDGFDALAVDNTAFLELPEPRMLRVHCPTSLASYRHALSALGNLELSPQEGAELPDEVDLRFSDEPIPSGPRAKVSFLTGVVPVDLQPLVSTETAFADVVDWDRTSPLLQHVQLLDVQIGDDPINVQGIGERDYELLGYQILAQGARGPLIVEKETPTGVDYVLLFHTDRSSLPYRVGFPILIANAVQLALDRSEIGEARAWPTGILPPRQVEPETEFTIANGTGSNETAKSSPTGLLTGISAPEPGKYTYRQGETLVASVGVGLLTATETKLQGVETLQFPETKVSTATSTIQTDRPLWSWFAGLGLILLLGEWWYFHRRPGRVAA
jgi:Ca-activated chloride channel homolog